MRGLSDTYLTAAYADVIDVNVLRLKDTATGLEEDTQRIEGKITSLQRTCDALAATVQQMVSFLGVLVPAWTTRQEVELGDEMGISLPSAAERELNVVFEMERQVPGFGHEDVITITPLAGTLVKRGSIVTVVLNLEG